MKSQTIATNNRTLGFLPLAVLLLLIGAMLLPKISFALSYDQKKVMMQATKATRNIDIRLRSQQSANDLATLLQKIDKMDSAVATYNIPANDPAYVKLKQLFTNTREKITAMGGSAAPVAAPKVAATPAPAAAPVSKPAAASPPKNVPLTYKQKKTMANVKRDLNNAMRRIQNVSNLNELLSDEKFVSGTKRALGTYNIPENDKTHQQLQQKFAQAEQLIAEKKGLFGSATGAATEADAKAYARDMELVKDLTHRYQPAGGVSASEQSAILWERLDYSLKWADELKTKHANMINSDLSEKRNFETKLRHYTNNIKGWRVKIEQCTKDSMSEVKEILKNVQQDAERAKKTKNPLIFSSGIPHSLRRAQVHFEFLDKAQKFKSEVVALSRQLDETRKTTNDAAATLEKEILESNRTPKEIYTGSDKSKLEKIILAAWKKEYPNEEVLSVIFHRDSWKRNNILRWNQVLLSWEHSDWSYLETVVVTKTNSDIATIYPAYINKNNLNSSINAGVQTRDGKHVVTKMLMKNL
ncbi:MAG: hypothetical protein KAT25_00375 [Sulfuriflexus sp.]|nr:hypothetical protein [Sulfuriflexus sp.]